jgi:hypothetical protein
MVETNDVWIERKSKKSMEWIHSFSHRMSDWPFDEMTIVESIGSHHPKCTPKLNLCQMKTHRHGAQALLANGRSGHRRKTKSDTREHDGENNSISAGTPK